MTTEQIEKTLHGLYLTITIIVIEGMRAYARLSLTDAGREYISETVTTNYIGDALRELAEDLEGSNDLHWINPEDIGALTESPMFTDELASIYNPKKDGFDDYPKSGVFAYGDYQINDPVSEMLEGREVRFEWHQGELDQPELNEDEQKALAALKAHKDESEVQTW